MNEHVQRVTIGEGPHGALLSAAIPIAAGEVVFVLTGEIVDTASKYTIQLDEHRHVLTHTSPWRFMNHACRPNVRIDAKRREMIAIRDVAAGEELTFNYNTTEWDMAAPFPCGCGAPDCAGVIRGFRHLDQARRAALAPLLSPFIASRVDRFD
jgi:hypothetical protein